MKKTLTRIFGLALLVTAMPAFADIIWNFPNSSDPSPANVGSGSADITLGSLGEGHFAGNPLNLGSQSGYWDLGSGGSILLSGMGLSGTFTLSIVQWVDSPLYNGQFTYKINNGSTFPLSFQDTFEPTAFGNWEKFGASLNLLSTDTITIYGPGGTSGAIVDRVMLTVVPEPATLIAGALLLLPFAFSTLRFIRRNKAAQPVPAK